MKATCTIERTIDLSPIVVRQQVSNVEVHKQDLPILLAILREYRWDILGTYDGYKVVFNGYDQIKRVETKGLLGTAKVIPAYDILSRMLQIDKTNGVNIHL